MVLVRAKIASVIFSGAGPPLPMLYLMPKSPSGPPGLWLADRMMPPKAAVPADERGDRRRRQEAARPTRIRPKPLAAAIRMAFWIASRL